MAFRSVVFLLCIQSGLALSLQSPAMLKTNTTGHHCTGAVHPSSPDFVGSCYKGSADLLLPTCGLACKPLKMKMIIKSWDPETSEVIYDTVYHGAIDAESKGMKLTFPKDSRTMSDSGSEMRWCDDQNKFEIKMKVAMLPGTTLEFKAKQTDC
eukprot:CAMPEP_0180445576 /NCGR_PEP_ID=MMETSP1036_2-20121128/15764_1 /TAXON_ID=632150 /ORGANISM="Azadinium spinosum, Strain 3D9" /LENGTH=152 /DNA_ID=CAMNT_0022451929 /DNA_START=90 /DNA_END=548 /DNA_ORIENTATION=-